MPFVARLVIVAPAAPRHENLCILRAKQDQRTMAFHDPFEADMQKRLLIAMVLSMVVLFWLVPALSPPAEPEEESRPGEAIALRQ